MFITIEDETGVANLVKLTLYEATMRNNNYVIFKNTMALNLKFKLD